MYINAFIIISAFWEKLTHFTWMDINTIRVFTKRPIHTFFLLLLILYYFKFKLKK
jgi:hypothetical protein